MGTILLSIFGIFLIFLILSITVIIGEFISYKFPESSFGEWWRSYVVSEQIEPQHWISEEDRINKFIDFVKSECQKNGVKFKAYKKPHVKVSNDIKCGGYFDDGSDSGKPTLAFALGHKDYLELLVHEYCHMTQWIDGIELWEICSDSMTIIDEWLSGKEHPEKLLQAAINNSRSLELDNEKRAVEIFKKWDLPVDVDLYTKKANAYVNFYNYLKVTRKWSSPDNSPYVNKNILEAMSSKFDMDYETLSPELLKIFTKEKI